MIFRQLFEPVSSTYTYLIGCEVTREAVLIDPVVNAMERDLAELHRLGLKIVATLDTHVHADHITSALHMKQQAGSRIAAPAVNRLACVDIGIEEGQPFTVGQLELMPLFTPGHTDDHFSYQLGERLFTGDALLIEGCGRTDFQNGNTDVLYRSITEKLFTLPDDTQVYPGHDYQQRRVTTIAQEKDRNPRIGQGKSLEEFRQIMTNLKLPYPKFIDYAVPGNRQCGVCPEVLPEQLQKYCAMMEFTPQG